MATFKIGDTVTFSAAVVRRCGYDKEIADRRGPVTAVRGNIVTFTLRDGTSKSAPAANLVRVKPDGLILDLD